MYLPNFLNTIYRRDSLYPIICSCLLGEILIDHKGVSSFLGSLCHCLCQRFFEILPVTHLSSSARDFRRDITSISHSPESLQSELPKTNSVCLRTMLLSPSLCRVSVRPSS